MSVWRSCNFINHSEEGGSNSEKEVSNENKDVFIASSPGYRGTGALAAADEAETKAHTGSHSVLVSPSEDPAVKEEPLVRAGFCAPKAGALLLDGKFPSESGGL